MNNNNFDRERRPKNVYPGRKPSSGGNEKPPHRHINPIEAERRRKERKIITRVAVIALLVIAIAVALIAKACGPNENTDDFRVVMEEKVTVPYSDVVRDGSVYLNAMELAYFCRMTVSGTYDELKLSTEAGGYVEFYPVAEGEEPDYSASGIKSYMSASINGAATPMSAPAILDEKILWIPADFVIANFFGVTVEIDREINKITIERVEAEGSTAEKPIYEIITFATRANSDVSDEERINAVISEYKYETDITSSLKYIEPSDRDGYLLLANKQNPLGESYVPENLSNIANKYCNKSDMQMVESAARALEALMAEMRAAGIKDVLVTSAYRSYDYQTSLFNHYINDEMSRNSSLSYVDAVKIVSGYSAEPGKSEHQSGLCADFITTDMIELNNEFEKHRVFVWLQENAAKFGFILRYPADKTDVTGYDYESWHYRFVGRYHATAIAESGLCFEEYLNSMEK